jgi:lysozyme
VNRTRLDQMLVRHEDDRRTPYRCPAGYLTIGVGRNLEAKPLSDAVVRLMLDEDVAEARATCKHLVPGFDVLAEARQHALLDMAFNLGQPRLAKFTKMLAAARAGDWETAAREAQDSDWYRQVGGSPGQRGHTVVAMLRTGVYP